MLWRVTQRQRRKTPTVLGLILSRIKDLMAVGTEGALDGPCLACLSSILLPIFLPQFPDDKTRYQRELFDSAPNSNNKFAARARDIYGTRKSARNLAPRRLNYWAIISTSSSQTASGSSSMKSISAQISLH